MEEVKQNGYVKTGKKYNVSDNCIRKWIKNYESEEDNDKMKEYIRKHIKCPNCKTLILKKSKMCDPCFRLSRRKVERPCKEQLLNEVKEFGYSGTGRKYGVSDNCIRKWLK